MTEQDRNCGDSPHRPSGTREGEETSTVVSSEEEFQIWLAKALEAERQRLPKKRG